jgi:RsiW-degrading membrane proteinase PrsW (M82 family)
MSATAVVVASIIAAAIPTLLYVALIYWVDRYEKEPWWLLTAAFLWGAIPSILVAFLFNAVLSLPVYLFAGESTGGTLAANLIAPPVEESIKGLALLGIFFLWRHEIDSPLDGIIYGAMVGMGFGMVENVYYFVSQYYEAGAQAWQINILVRGVVFGLNHALFTSMTGLGIATARMSTDRSARVFLPVAGWMMAIMLHFLHNASVQSGNLLCLVALISDWGGVGLTLAIIVWALVQERRWIREYLAEEVSVGTLTTRQYETACSGRKRTWHNLRLLFSRGLAAYRKAAHFYYRCSELAYKKHHFSLFGDQKNKERIIMLRREIAELSLFLSRGS